MILNTSEPIFEQIYKEYKKLIELGVFNDGDKLPSVRELAYELGVNPNTVKRAYDLLINDKIVKSIEKKGIFVSYNADITKLSEAKVLVNDIKKLGVDKDELIKIIDEVYKGGDND